MHVLAAATIGTETGQVVGAQHTSDMPVSAMWTVSAETTVIPGAVLDFALGIDV